MTPLLCAACVRDQNPRESHLASRAPKSWLSWTLAQVPGLPQAPVEGTAPKLAHGGLCPCGISHHPGPLCGWGHWEGSRGPLLWARSLDEAHGCPWAGATRRGSSVKDASARLGQGTGVIRSPRAINALRWTRSLRKPRCWKLETPQLSREASLFPKPCLACLRSGLLHGVQGLAKPSTAFTGTPKTLGFCMPLIPCSGAILLAPPSSRISRAAYPPTSRSPCLQASCHPNPHQLYGGSPHPAPRPHAPGSPRLGAWEERQPPGLRVLATCQHAHREVKILW